MDSIEQCQSLQTLTSSLWRAGERPKTSEDQKALVYLERQEREVEPRVR